MSTVGKSYEKAFSFGYRAMARYHSTPPLLVKQRLQQETFDITEGRDAREVMKPSHLWILPRPHSAISMWAVPLQLRFKGFRQESLSQFFWGTIQHQHSLSKRTEDSWFFLQYSELMQSLQIRATHCL